MASQREWESVVWHFIADTLNTTSPEKIAEWIYDFPPDTPAQKKRWLKAISKVHGQAIKFAGENQVSQDLEYAHEPV